MPGAQVDAAKYCMAVAPGFDKALHVSGTASSRVQPVARSGSLMLMAMLLAPVSNAAEPSKQQAAPTYSGYWHLEIKPAREVTTIFHEENSFPHLNPTKWILIAG